MAKKQTIKNPVAAPAQGDNHIYPAHLRYLWIVIMVLMGFLLVYNKLDTDKAEAEAANAAEPPVFDGDAWFSGVYQDKEEAYLKSDSRIGKELLPLKNQVDYSLLHKYNMEDYVRGKGDYLISEGNIYSYLGKNYVGDSTVNENVRKLKVISDSLERKHIDLVVLFAPTKEYAIPEIIPEKYLVYKKRKNSYEAYLEAFKKAGIKHMDLLPFVQALRKSYQYPIYPQYGTHLSYFTECMVADTVIRFIEQLRGHSMPHIAWQTVDYPATPRMRDADAIGKARLKVMPHSIPMAYPAITYRQAPGARPVKTLGIGDSYYRAFMYLGVAQVAFGNGEYWYYYSTVVPETPDRKEVWEYDLKTKLEENEVVLLYYASGNLHRLGDGFIDDAYQLYTDPAAYYARIKRDLPLKRKIKEIHDDPDLLYEAERDAKKQHIPLDTEIRLKAMDEIGQ